MATPAEMARPFAATAPRPPLGLGNAASVRQGRIACALLVLGSLALLQFNVHHGLSVTPDSTRYMGISPIPYDAPVYHWMLVLPHALGVPLLTAAMAWAIVTLCTNVVMIFALLRRAAGDWRHAAVGTALVALAPQFVALHASVISEPPFISFVLFTLWFVLDYFEHGRQRDLVIASLMLGMATLARFTAPPLGAAIVLVLLTTPRLPLARRVADSVLMAVPGAALFFGWVILSTLTVGHSIGREMRFYGNMGPAQWRANLETTAAWLFPDNVPLAFRVSLLVLLLGFAGWQFTRQLAAWRNERADAPSDARTALSLVLGLFFVGYLAFVWLSTMLEANLSFVGRYGLPAYLVLAMLLTLQASGLDRRLAAPRAMWFALAALAAVILASHTVRTVSRTHDAYREGSGFHARIWRESPTIAAVRALPAASLVYSNGPEVVTLLTDRRAGMVPMERLLRTNRPDPNDPPEAQIARIRGEAAAWPERPVYVVAFDNIDWRFYLASEDRLRRALSLVPVASFADGRIYRVSPAVQP
ncbi:glycosyltransferase family 39 protein [Novosphingobium aerophilum]|uniref:glycosyltransferase family 39 protein n=1 Tax=Novosphingobium TaxID=165696 RepID=UPI0006C87539|nr:MULTISPECIES: glycosyltransferase family 39 protein [unclassified Novosphingobium]TCM37081.1 dolichyl-phosphate-mannose-protein mannosyltransferase [Novosphingobium sp. ST904]WRT94348.1 glycosyltransferase family 39 protein [Novosphingobium sp. RL4]